MDLFHRNKASGKLFQSLSTSMGTFNDASFPGQEVGRGGGGGRAAGWALRLLWAAPSRRWTGPRLHILREHHTSLPLSRSLNTPQRCSAPPERTGAPSGILTIPIQFAAEKPELLPG